MKKFDIKRFFIRLRVFFRKRFRIFSKHPKRTLFGIVAVGAIAIFFAIMFATPVFFNATVRFETGEGSIIYDKTIRRGTTLPQIQDPIYEYNTFEGWFFDKEYTIPYENQKIYSDTILYAKWDSVFNEEYFIERIELINDIYGINLYEQSHLPLLENGLVEDDIDDLTNPTIVDNVDLSFNIDYDNFRISSIVMNTREYAELIYNIFLHELFDSELSEANDMYLIDKAAFFIPKGMEGIFLGEIEFDKGFYYTVNERGNYTLLRYNGDDKQISVPYEFNYKPIDFVASHAFSYTQMEEISFTENIKEIGFSLFWESELKEIDFSTGLTALAGGALFGIQNLEVIKLSESIESIGLGALSECPSLREIIIDENNPNYTLHQGVLYNKDMKKLIAYPPMKQGKSYIVPEGVEELGGGSFAFNNYLENITLPQSLKVIFDSSFKNSFNLREINIPDSVEVIGEKVFMNSSLEYVGISPLSQLERIGLRAFFDNENLKEIYIPSGVTNFEGSEFRGCINLEKVVFGSGNLTKVLAQQMFMDCHNLLDIRLPSSVMEIEDDVFSNCYKLEEINIFNVLDIGNRVFQGCNSLASIEFSSNLRYIGRNALENTALTNVVIPPSVSFIDEQIFYLTELESLTAPIYVNGISNTLGYYFGHGNHNVPDTLEVFAINSKSNIIPKGYFQDVKYIETIVLPDNLLIIEDNAFEGCSSLSSIDLPQSLVEIGNAAFMYCSSLTELSFPDSLEIIGDFAFFGHDVDSDKMMNFESINFSENSLVSSIGSYAFANNTKIREFSIDIPLSFLGDYAFKNSSLLEEVNLPSIGNMGMGVFYNCLTLESLEIPLNDNYQERTPSFLSYYFGSEDYDGFWRIPDSLKRVTVIEGISKLSDYAFYRAENVEEVLLPSGIETIGDYAFAGLNTIPMNISSIQISDANIKGVGRYAFQYCQNLEGIDLGQNIESVGDFAFDGAVSLKEIHIPNAQNIGRGILRGNESLDKLSVPLQDEYNQFTNSYIAYFFSDEGGFSGGMEERVPLTLRTVNISQAEKIAENAFRNCENIESIIIDNAIEEIGEYSFYNNTALQAIDLREGLKLIKRYAFSGCENLTEVNIPSTILHIEINAFAECRLLQRVVFAPQSMPASIGDYAFYNCESLEYINIPNNSIFEIREGTFLGCSSLKEINLPRGLQYIRSSAFASSGLESLALPYTLTEIGYAAFMDNQSLSEIIFDYENSRLQVIGEKSFMGCVSLEEIILPESLLQIVNMTFYNCINLRDVYVLREYNYLNPVMTMGTRLELGNEFDNCHEDLKIYVPKNNAGIVEDGVPHPDAKNGVTMYKRWSQWEAYSDIIEAMPE